MISSHEVQEYLYFIVFYVDFTILLKHVPGLDSLGLQGFTKVKKSGPEILLIKVHFGPIQPIS